MPKAAPGEKVAVISPSFAAPGFAPAIHEQALRRLTEVTGLIPVEYPTTRHLGASAIDRALDINAAFRDPEIKTVLATIGGEDQITVIPHLDTEVLHANPKPFLGYSDNTNLLNWMWTNGVPAFYGGSTQVHLGPGPHVDHVHKLSLRAALLSGEQLEITEPGESEDFGRDWKDPLALSTFGEREPTEPWVWQGPSKAVTGRTWGGCIEVIQWILTAGRFPTDPSVLDGAILMVESSEDLISSAEFGWILRSLGERGILEAVSGVLVGRPPASSHEMSKTSEQRRAYRHEQRDAAIDVIQRYNPDAVIVVGVPFGHTRPQWILPYGGYMTLDRASQKVFANYS